jgi:hypothetical protein
MEDLFQMSYTKNYAAKNARRERSWQTLKHKNACISLMHLVHLQDFFEAPLHINFCMNAKI